VERKEIQMSNEAIVVFTSKSLERMVSEGGTSSWRLNRNNARQRSYVVCTRNAYADDAEGSEEHRSAFLVGKIKDIVHAPGEAADRFLILFSEYAKVNFPETWRNDRNPVRYATLEELGIDAQTLDWKSMPEVSDQPTVNSEGAPRKEKIVHSLTLDEAKKGLALTFGVSPDAIEIIIRG
jgi:hypothetical protein